MASDSSLAQRHGCPDLVAISRGEFEVCDQDTRPLAGDAALARTCSAKNLLTIGDTWPPSLCGP